MKGFIKTFQFHGSFLIFNVTLFISSYNIHIYQERGFFFSIIGYDVSEQIYILGGKEFKLSLEFKNDAFGS